MIPPFKGEDALIRERQGDVSENAGILPAFSGEVIAPGPLAPDNRPGGLLLQADRTPALPGTIGTSRDRRPHE